MGVAVIQVEEWDETHSRWPDLVRSIREETDERNPQEKWAFQSHPLGTPGIHFLAAVEDGRVVGFLKFVEQVIGPDDNLPPISDRGARSRKLRSPPSRS